MFLACLPGNEPASTSKHDSARTKAIWNRKAVSHYKKQAVSELTKATRQAGGFPCTCTTLPPPSDFGEWRGASRPKCRRSLPCRRTGAQGPG